MWFFGRSIHTLPAIGLALTEDLDNLSIEEKKRYKEKTEELAERIANLLGEYIHSLVSDAK